jgi:hypothetical protein
MGADVVIVKVPADPTATEAVGPVQIGASPNPLDGPDVCAQVSCTIPVYPLAPLTVTAALVEPPGLEIAPGAVVTDNVNIDSVTVTLAVLLAVP